MKSSGAGNGTSSSKVDRKTVEKNRRIHMKTLCFKLGSLIPKEDRNTKDNIVSQHDYLDQAVSYIKKLKARIEKLRQRRRYPTGSEPEEDDGKADSCRGIAGELVLPAVEVRYRDPILEVVLVTGPAKKFSFYDVIGVLVEEGAEVVNASFSVVNDKTFYTAHSQVVSSRQVVPDAARISERLKELTLICN